MIAPWEMLKEGVSYHDLGLVYYWFSLGDDTPTRDLIDRHYKQGGGFNEIDGFTLSDNNCLQYPGDPVLEPLAQLRRGPELVVFYDFALLAIIQQDRTFQVTRVN